MFSWHYINDGHSSAFCSALHTYKTNMQITARIQKKINTQMNGKKASCKKSLLSLSLAFPPSCPFKPMTLLQRVLFLVFHWTEKPFSFFRISLFFHYTISSTMIIRSRCIQPLLAILTLLHLDTIQALIDNPAAASCDHPSNYSDFTVLLVNNTIIATGGNAVSGQGLCDVAMATHG